MDLDNLHGIIDDTQMASPHTQFNVVLVDENGMVNHDITEVYINNDSGTIYLMFNSKNGK
jgi:hypothetical protein